MRTASGIGSSLFGKTKMGVLSLLVINNYERFYTRQIVRETGLGMGAVQRELGSLTKSGILLREREGRQVYYQANRACPIYEELRAILVKTGGVADVLRERLEGVKGKCRIAFVYGSVAEGSESAESDIDIMVVGATTLTAVSRAIGDARSALRREVNLTVYPVSEFVEKLDTPFLKSVMAKPKVFLIGDQDELEGLVG